MPPQPLPNSAQVKPASQQPTGDLASLNLLVTFFRPYVWRAAAATLAMLVSAAMLLALGQGVRLMVDRGIGTGGMAQLNETAIGMVFVILAFGIASGFRFYFVNWMSDRITADLRLALFNRLISLSPGYFETARTGDLLSRLSADTSVLQVLVSVGIAQWLRNVVMLIGALVMLVYTSPRLSLFVVGAVPIIIGPVLWFGRRERKLSKLSQDRLADIGAYAEETINAIRTVQAFNHAEVDRRRYSDNIDVGVRTSLTRIRARSIYIMIVILLSFGAITLGVWVGGLEVVSHRMTGGELTAFLFYSVLIATSGTTVTELMSDLKRAAGASERLVELLNEQPLIRAPAHPKAMPVPPQGRVAFNDVTFHYPARPDEAALRGLSFTVERGETVALVGPSGAGKSTVFQLLLRFYDPESGRVMIDGIDVKDATPEDVRSKLGLVAQDPVIFGTNAWENIRYGRPDASDAEVRAAAEVAAATEFLDRLPNGFDTFLGEKGVRLSGGQRQRIAIARAVLRDPPILLLDEATSALDAESERLVQQALNFLAKGRTMLVIAHRLATVRQADRILVFDKGRVVGNGTHDALVREDGLYSRLAALQFTGAAA